MNIYEKRSIRSYQKKADHYDSTFDGRFTFPFKEKLLETVNIPVGGNLLDVACGNGKLLQMLSARYSFNGFGADISEKMVGNAGRLNPSMTFRTARCDALPFEDEFFDVVTVSAAFHHFPDVKGFAKEAHRVLKPDGMLYIAEVYYPGLIRIMYNPLIKLSRAGDVKLYAPEDIIMTFESTGFTFETVEKEGHIQIVGVRRSR